MKRDAKNCLEDKLSISLSLSLSLSLKCGGKKFVGVMDACRGEGLPIYTNYKDPHHLRRSP